MKNQFIYRLLLVLALLSMSFDAKARWYKADLGRFYTMDSYDGDPQEPLSLHKYLYCQANPVNHTDPSGHELEVLEVEVIGENMEMAEAGEDLVVEQAAERSIGNSYATALLAVLTGLILSDDTGIRPIPTMYYSKHQFPIIARHIEVAQSRLPNLLHYVGPFRDLQNFQRNNAVAPYKKKPKPQGYTWDEYPFASTVEGGKDDTSVAAAPVNEQSRQGAKHSSFYSQNHMAPLDPFFVKVIP